jgi:hypothetical protein
MINQSTIKTIFESLPLDVWYEIFALLDIKDAIAVSKANPRTFGAYIKDQQVIRFKNTINSAPSSLRVLGGMAAGYSSFRSWLQRNLFKSCIVPPSKLFPPLSSIIASKDRGFESISVSSFLSDWDVILKAEDDSVCCISWTLLYRGSLFGFDVVDFYRACGGMESCVVVVRAEIGRIAAAYNEDGFYSDESYTPNRNGFIMSIKEDGSCGPRFDRNEDYHGIYNHPLTGPVFHIDLGISGNCHENEISISKLGRSYGGGDVNEYALFEQEYFRVRDYEVFKIEIEVDAKDITVK